MELQRNPPPSTDPNTRVFTIRGTAQQMDLARQLIDDKIGVRKPKRTSSQRQHLKLSTQLVPLQLSPKSTQCDLIMIQVYVC